MHDLKEVRSIYNNMIVELMSGLVFHLNNFTQVVGWVVLLDPINGLMNWICT